MITKISTVAVCVLLLSPLSGFSGEQKNALLKAYFSALSKGDLTQLNTLLNQDFEYHYYKDGKQKKLGRDEDLKSLGQLFKDARTNSFNELELFKRDKNSSNKFHIKFLIGFEDSPKLYTESVFRGGLLEINETVIILTEANKIDRIIELENKNQNSLSFGYLKSIHLGKTEVKAKEINGGWMFELLDKNTRELLLTKKSAVEKGAISERYYWPNGQEIVNFK
jgi:hypothetical protein